MSISLGRMLVRYRSVLAVPGSARLFATGVLARLPQGMASLTILLLVRAATHSYAVAGLAIGGEALSCALAGPVQGRLIDRFGRAWVLMPCAVAQAGLFVALVLVARAGGAGVVLLMLACAVGVAQPAIAPSVRGLLRTLVSDAVVRESAFALESVVQELIWITGPLLVGIAVTVASADAAALLCASVGLVGASLFVFSPAARGGVRAPGGPHRAVLRAVPALRGLLVPVALMGAGIGATEFGLPSLALHAGSRSSSGLLLAVWSVGSMIGGLASGARDWELPLAERYRRLLLTAVLCAVPLLFARSIPAGLIGALFAGLTIAPVFSCQYALVARAVPTGIETEAFTWVSGALVAGLAGGQALAGVLVGQLGVSGPFLISIAALAAAALTAVSARRVAATA